MPGPSRVLHWEGSGPQRHLAAGAGTWVSWRSTLHCKAPSEHLSSPPPDWPCAPRATVPSWWPKRTWGEGTGGSAVLTGLEDPLQVPVELPLYLLLPPQLQEGSAVLHPLTLLGELPVERGQTTKGGELGRATPFQVSPLLTWALGGHRGTRPAQAPTAVRQHLGPQRASSRAQGQFHCPPHPLHASPVICHPTEELLDKNLPDDNFHFVSSTGLDLKRLPEGEGTDRNRKGWVRAGQGHRRTF